MEPAYAWRVLGLAAGSAPADIRGAFRTATQLLHPDRLGDASRDVRAEAQRRMAELAEAYGICRALSVGELPPPPRSAHDGENLSSPLRSVGGLAGQLLAQAEATVAPRDSLRLLEQVANAWPGTYEGDRARVLLVTSESAGNALSPRERAGHLVVVVDPTARRTCWDAIDGRDGLSVAQVVYAHPTAPADLRALARERLAAHGDWATLSTDDDVEVATNALARLLIEEARVLTERAAWLERRERPAFNAAYAEWRRRRTTLETLPDDLDKVLSAADTTIAAALRTA